MPRFVAPVQPYMMDTSAIIKAYQYGLAQENPLDKLMQGVQTGMSMASMAMAMKDKYGPEAKLAKQQEAQLKDLQIVQAQQAVAAGNYKLAEDAANLPNLPKLADLNLRQQEAETGIAELNKKVAELKTGNLPQEIEIKNLQADLAITSQQLGLANQAMQTDVMATNLAQSKAMLDGRKEIIELVKQGSTTKDPTKFHLAYNKIGEYGLLWGMGDTEKMWGYLAQNARIAGLQNDPTIQGLLNKSSPMTLAGVDSLTKGAVGEQKKWGSRLAEWSLNYADGKVYKRDAVGTPIPGPNNGEPVPIADLTELKKGLQSVYGTMPDALTIANGTKFVGSSIDGSKYTYERMSDGFQFALPAESGAYLNQLLEARDGLQQTSKGLAITSSARNWMAENGMTSIPPEQYKSIVAKISGTMDTGPAGRGQVQQQSTEQPAPAQTKTQSAGPVQFGEAGNSPNPLLPPATTPPSSGEDFQAWIDKYKNFKSGKFDLTQEEKIRRDMIRLKQLDPKLYDQIVSEGDKQLQSDKKTAASYFQ